MTRVGRCDLLMAVLAAAFVATGITGCGRVPDEGTVTVYMTNNSTEPVHLWVEGTEGVFSPGNIPLGSGSAVQPGKVRTRGLFYSTTTGGGDDMSVWVGAGSNGQLLDKQGISFTTGTVLVVNAIWDGQKLTVR